MTELNLEELERICNAATSGPWVEGEDNAHFGPITVSICRNYCDDDYDKFIEMTEVDATFISTAREALPQLIAEVRRLREELDHAEKKARVLALRLAELGQTHGIGEILGQASPDEWAEWAEAKAKESTCES